MRFGEAKVDAGLHAAAAQLLIVALTHHPSLVDLLLFPTSLAGAAQGAAPAEVSPAVSTVYQILLLVWISLLGTMQRIMRVCLANFFSRI